MNTLSSPKAPSPNSVAIDNGWADYFRKHRTR